MINRIVIDLDGTLVDFVGGATQLFERPTFEPVEYDFFDELAGSERQFWAKIDATPHFWENLQGYPWTDSLLCVCRRVCPHITVASVAQHHSALSGKRKWLEKHAKPLRHSFMFGREKALLAAPGRVLIDDSPTQCDEWLKAGGQAVLFPQPWNSNRAFCDVRVDFVKATLKEFARR